MNNFLHNLMNIFNIKQGTPLSNMFLIANEHAQTHARAHTHTQAHTHSTRKLNTKVNIS